MSETYGKTTALSVLLNGRRLGLVSGLRERLQRELQPVTCPGITPPTKLVIGKTQVILTLKRLVPELPDSTVETLLNTRGFILQISDGTSTVVYRGCEVAAMTTLSEAGEYRLEEVEICAASREKV